jgi:hypothetical protein
VNVTVEELKVFAFSVSVEPDLLTVPITIKF